MTTKTKKRKASLRLSDVAKAIHSLDLQTHNNNERQALACLLRFAAESIERRCCEVLHKRKVRK